MVSLSKSKYCKVWQCPKLAWLNKYKPELAIIDESAKDRMQTGNEVGDLAMGLFGDFIEVTSYKEDSSLNLSRMIATTAEEMNKGTEVICEASFSYEGLYCAVDILKKENNGYSIYEVKSSSTDMDELDINPVYVADISYQKYVLEHCGVNVTGTYLVTLNKKYVLNGDLDLSGLFNIIDVSKKVSEEIANVEGILSIAEALRGDIPRDVCVTAFNKSFECSRLKELAALFPDLSEHLLNIESNIKDFLVPFRSGYYYNKAMGGSFSIKSVLPALFPDDPALDYHNLEGIHNGGEAMTIFPKMKHMSEEEQKQTRNNLLKYCELDTYAMVKVWEKLVDAAK